MVLWCCSRTEDSNTTTNVLESKRSIAGLVYQTMETSESVQQQRQKMSIYLATNEVKPYVSVSDRHESQESERL